MTICEIILTGIGLSMDAFAVSLVRGLSMKKFDVKQAVIVAFTFGAFQAIMPLIGWLLGSSFRKYIVNFDHWVAFGLLVIIGGKMIFDAVKGDDDEIKSFDVKNLLIMAVATSIDALAVGVSLSFLDVNLASAVTIIGVVTFIICMIGVGIGHLVGSKFRKRSAIIGGVVLIAIGTKILLEHLGVL